MCFVHLRTISECQAKGIAPLCLNATIKKEGSSEVVIYTEYVRKIVYKHSGAVDLKFFGAFQINLLGIWPSKL